MIEKLKSWRHERKIRKKNLIALIRKVRAGERRIADKHYTKELKKQRKQYIDEIRALNRMHDDDLENLEKDLTEQFIKEMEKKDAIIRKKDKRMKKADDAWDFMQIVGERYYKLSREAQTIMEIMKDTRAADYARVDNLSDKFEALKAYIVKNIPKMEKLLSIQERKQEEREKIIAGEA